MICAEHISKLHEHVGAEGKSRYFTRKFFVDHVLDEDKRHIMEGFVRHGSSGLQISSLDEAINGLYDVRCSVVHEGKYWNFHFFQSGTPMLNLDPNFIVKLSFSTLRAIVLRGCINAANSVSRTLDDNLNDILKPVDSHQESVRHGY
jgi:hypothetical protein